MPFPTNVTCNRTCVFELEENAFFNLEDSVITRGRSTYIANDPELLQARFSSCLSHRFWPSLMKQEDYIETVQPVASDLQVHVSRAPQPQLVWWQEALQRRECSSRTLHLVGSCPAMPEG